MTDGKHRWLAVEYSNGHGSGFGSCAEDWYEVSGNGIKLVLTLQTGLFRGFGINPLLERNTKVLSMTYRDGITTAVLQSSTTYEGHNVSDDYTPTWRNKRRATFIKGPGMQRFVLDTLHSEMTAVELDPYYGSEEDVTKEQFLKYNYRELSKIVTGKESLQKEWLRHYLGTCDDSIEKESLQKALETDGHE